MSRSSPQRRPTAALLALALATLEASTALAHAFAPAFLELRELAPRRIAVTFRPSPDSLETGLSSPLRPELPARCHPIGAAADTGGGRWIVDCGEAGIAGSTVRLRGLPPDRLDVLWRYRPLAGDAITGVLTAAAPSFTLPRPRPPLSPLRSLTSYGRLGLLHVLSGLDHLLFVLGLLLLAPGLAPVLRTVTAFTVGHSLTLGLATLDLVRLPAPPVEAAIALSVLLLAVELQRGDRAPTRRRPWLVAALFGLLHGFGFAGALRDHGLPDGQLGLALAGFNLGVELGQLLFVAVALLVARLATAGHRSLPTRALAAYAMGGVASALLFDRLSALLA